MREVWRTIRLGAVAIPLFCTASLWAADEQSSEQAPQDQSTTTAAGGTYEASSSSVTQVPDTTVTPFEVTPQMTQGLSRETVVVPTPQEVGAAPNAVQTTNGVIGYKPIPESALPVNMTGKPLPPPQAPGPTPTTLGGPSFTMGPYTLGQDDVVHILVRGQPDFTGTYVIGHNGSIQYGFVGDVKADGLTKEQLRDVLIEKLKQYVRVPAIQVSIVGFNSKAIYILGRVARPGKYAMRGDSIKIRDAVIAAGLVIQHAKLRQVHIVKSDPKDPTFRVIDLFNVLYKGKMQDNVELVNGDIVVVPTTIWGGINDFLSGLLSPTSHAASVAALATL